MAKKKKAEAAEAEAVAVEQKETAAVAETVSAPKAAESTVYIGRSVLGLPQYTVFKGGELPAHVQQIAEEYEGLTRLIVPISKLQSARADVGKKGTAMHLFFNNMKKKN